MKNWKLFSRSPFPEGSCQLYPISSQTLLEIQVSHLFSPHRPNEKHHFHLNLKIILNLKKNCKNESTVKNTYVPFIQINMLLTFYLICLIICLNLFISHLLSIIYLSFYHHPPIFYLSVSI